MKTAVHSRHGAIRVSCVLALVALTAGVAAHAGSLGPIGAGGSVVITTDYVYRGLTQSQSKAALQADVHLQTTSGWFAGAWGSLTSSPPPVQSRSEINLYLGKSWALSEDWTASAHYARYLYPDDRPWPRYYYQDYDELQLSVSLQDRLNLSLAWSPEVRRYALYGPQRRSGRQLSYEASLRQPLWRNLALTAGLGYYDLSDLFGESYWAWSGGAELAMARLTFTLSRFGTDRTARHLFGPLTADRHWALTAALRF